MTRKLGIIAGGKELPKEIIAHCREINRPYFVLAFEGQTDTDTVIGSDHTWIHFGEFGKAVKALKKAGVEDIVMAGSMRRPSWQELRPDMKGALWVARVAKNALGDDSMLRILIGLIEGEGFKVVGSADLIGSNILAPSGIIGSCKPDKQALKDIEHGFKTALILGQADIGQSLIIERGMILGVEAMEGTNELIKRCEALHRKGPGGVLVKVAKPMQDRRVDLPTIGIETLELAVKHGLQGVAVQANNVQIMQRKQVIEFANKQGLFVYGIADDTFK